MIESATARLALPMLSAGQAQKEMSHNEALTLLDMAVQGAVEAADSDVPPIDPEPGQCWIVGGEPEGAWSGHAGEVAGWTAGGWRFVVPREGMRLWLGGGEGFALFREGAWRLGELHGTLFVDGEQVVGARAAAIMEPTGGTTVDAEARATIVAVLEALRAHGLVDGA